MVPPPGNKGPPPIDDVPAYLIDGCDACSRPQRQISWSSDTSDTLETRNKSKDSSCSGNSAAGLARNHIYGGGLLRQRSTETLSSFRSSLSQVGETEHTRCSHCGLLQAWPACDPDYACKRCNHTSADWSTGDVHASTPAVSDEVTFGSQLSYTSDDSVGAFPIDLRITVKRMNNFAMLQRQDSAAVSFVGSVDMSKSDMAIHAKAMTRRLADPTSETMWWGEI